MLLQIEEEQQEEQQEKEREREGVNLVDNRDKDECTISNWFNGFFSPQDTYPE